MNTYQLVLLLSCCCCRHQFLQQLLLLGPQCCHLLGVLLPECLSILASLQGFVHQGLLQAFIG